MIGGVWGKSHCANKYLDTKRPVIFHDRNSTGCSAARLAHWFWEPGVGGSNPLTPTRVYHESGRLAQLEERLPYKQDVGGSSPSTPTIFFISTKNGDR